MKLKLYTIAFSEHWRVAALRPGPARLDVVENAGLECQCSLVIQIRRATRLRLRRCRQEVAFCNQRK